MTKQVCDQYASSCFPSFATLLVTAERSATKTKPLSAPQATCFSSELKMVYCEAHDPESRKGRKVTFVPAFDHTCGPLANCMPEGAMAGDCLRVKPSS